MQQYLAELPGDRRHDVAKLIQVVRDNLPPGFDEVMAWGMIGYQVPLEVSGPTYNGEPIGPVAIAAQKHYLAIYLLSIYASPDLTAEFKARWLKSGHKLDMGKSCVRFKNLDHADLPTIAWAVSLLDPLQFTQLYLSSRRAKK